MYCSLIYFKYKDGELGGENVPQPEKLRHRQTRKRSNNQFCMSDNVKKKVQIYKLTDSNFFSGGLSARTSRGRIGVENASQNATIRWIKQSHQTDK